MPGGAPTAPSRWPPAPREATVFSRIESVRLLRVLALIFLTLLGVGVLPAQTRKGATSTQSTAEKCGPLAGQVLDCPKFGFIYKVIFGWVDRTADMQQDESLPDQVANESSKPTNSGS